MASKVPATEYGDGKKVASAPEGYQKMKVVDGKTYYKSPKSIKQAKATTNPTGGEAYENFLKAQLSSGVSPEQLAEANYISPAKLDSYREFYKPNVVYTQPEPTPDVKNTTLDFQREPVIDRKLLTGQGNDYMTYAYPDVNAGYSKATNKYFDPKSNQEIDPLKSYNNGSYNPYYVGGAPSSGTLKNNVPTVSDIAVSNDAEKAKPVMNQGFAKGGMVNKKLAGCYAFGTTEDGVTPQYGDNLGTGLPAVQTTGGSSGYSSAFAKANAGTANNMEAQKQSGQGRRAANAAGNALGTYGAGYYAGQEYETQGDGIRGKALGAAGAFGPIGGAISGLAGIGDQIGKPIKAKAEAMDANGNLVDPSKAKRNAVIGSLFSPSKAISTRSSYKGGWTDITGNKYAKHLEEKEKERLAAERETALAEKNELTRSRMDLAQEAREMGEVGYDDGYRDITTPAVVAPNKRDRIGSMVAASQANGGGGQSAGVLKDAWRGLGKKIFADGGEVKSRLDKFKSKYYMDGGEVKGAGGPKSDSNPAQLEEGSFVVPAENLEVAKDLAKNVLGKDPDKKADLNQEGGVPDLHVSDGEYIFTPRERIVLLKAGIDLKKLAPLAHQALRK